MKTMQEIIKDSVSDLPQDQKEEQEALLTKIFEEGQPIKQVLNLPESFFEFFYGQAYRMYNSGQYHDAQQIFLFLSLIDPLSVRYSIGIAACQQMQKQYAQAIDTYATCVPLDPHSPIPFYHASDCYVKLGNLFMGWQCLSSAVLIAGDDPKYANIVERSLLTMHGLQNAIEKEIKNAEGKKSE